MLKATQLSALRGAQKYHRAHRLARNAPYRSISNSLLRWALYSTDFSAEDQQRNPYYAAPTILVEYVGPSLEPVSYTWCISEPTDSTRPRKALSFPALDDWCHLCN